MEKAGYTFAPPNGVGNGMSLSVDCRANSNWVPSIAAFRVNGTIVVNNNYVAPTPGETKLTKTTVYDTTLTFASDKDISDMSGSIFMTDGVGDGPYTQNAYKLTTTDIESVSVTPNVWAGTQSGTPRVGMPGIWNGNDQAQVSSGNGIDVANTGSVRFTFDTPIPVGNGTWSLLNSGAPNYSNIWNWEDDNGVHRMSGGSGIHSSGWGVDNFSPQPVGSIKWFEIGNSPGFGVSNLLIDGQPANSGLPENQGKTTLKLPWRCKH